MSGTILEEICIAGCDPDFLATVRVGFDLGSLGDTHARTAVLFDHLAEAISYQGISDSVARAVIERDGSAEWRTIQKAIRSSVSCPKLASYWHFHGCGFTRSRGTCSEEEHYSQCPLPALPLRNGRLNQAAYSLFLFIRDICQNDLVGWLDARLASVRDTRSGDYGKSLSDAVCDPVTRVHGLADKTVRLALSGILLTADPSRELWVLAGAHTVVIDTLVHNLLHRTGTLRQHGAEHSYGPRCYGENGCAEIIRRLASKIDAQDFNPAYPKHFPRLVQHALWRFCAQEELNICNGNQIDDNRRCRNRKCPVFGGCGRLPLRPGRT